MISRERKNRLRLTIVFKHLKNSAIYVSHQQLNHLRKETKTQIKIPILEVLEMFRVKCVCKRACCRLRKWEEVIMLLEVSNSQEEKGRTLLQLREMITHKI